MIPIHVIGHINPDTDAIAAAVGYAWLLRERDKKDARACRAGALNPQTDWALKHFSLEPPLLLADASPRFSAIARKLDHEPPDTTLGQAYALAFRTGSVAPLVSTDDRPVGMLTGASVFRYLAQTLAERPDLAALPVGQLLAMPAIEAADTDVPAYGVNEVIRDARDRILRAEHDDFWVLDEQGRYAGGFRTPDALNPPRLQVVLVDHNEPGQALGALDEADLLEVLDHHRLGNATTRLPIPFVIDPVGSTSTLVTERVAASGLRPPWQIAGLLLAGLLSDTLILTSPTTTERDRRIAARLWGWAAVEDSPLVGSSVETFGRALLQAGAGLGSRSAAEIVSGDFKLFDAGAIKFGLAQIEVTRLEELDGRLEEIRAALNDLRARHGLALAVLMVTNVVHKVSRLVLSGETARLRDLPYARRPDGTLEAPGLVSRKVQLLPAILGLLQG